MKRGKQGKSRGFGRQSTRVILFLTYRHDGTSIGFQRLLDSAKYRFQSSRTWLFPSCWVKTYARHMWPTTMPNLRLACHMELDCPPNSTSGKLMKPSERRCYCSKSMICFFRAEKILSSFLRQSVSCIPQRWEL